MDLVVNTSGNVRYKNTQLANKLKNMLNYDISRRIQEEAIVDEVYTV